MTRGKFTLYYGCMFAGKTTSLIQHCLKSKHAYKSVFKPNLDTRYHPEKVYSHNGEFLEAVSVEKARDILNYVNKDYHLVAIDEMQFFEPGIISVVAKLLKAGHDVVGSGLDKDYLNKDFGSMPFLIRMADCPINLYAKCFACGQPAMYSFRKVSSSGLIVPGHADNYEARCENCYPYHPRSIEEE